MIRVGVIGAGSMGRNHLRVLRDLPDVDLVAVAEADVSLAEQAAHRYGIKAYRDHRELLRTEHLAAVTVAVPTTLHHEVGVDALQAGCHVLIEKPIAATLEAAEALVAASAAAGRILMVGHVERYNPAIIELKRRLHNGEGGRIFEIHTRRLGPFPERIRDVGVVLDLATHDLDIIRYLSDSEIVRLYAETRRNVHGSNEDLSCAILGLANEAVGVVELNWLTPTKVRDVTVTGERGMFRAEYLTQDLFFYENAEVGQEGWEHLRILRGVREGVMTRFAVNRQEPLHLEMRAFMEAARGGAADTVTGVDGVAALRLALALLQSGSEHQPITLPR
ncbi:MAG: Gfo/Idh/MocA family oxidoreductase [Candidatus Dormibacteraeota bacterium]|nr:Gfo/Idh/MocA family oxidoreductase [Candidatus Dormibacteraeota bacterium]